MQKNPERIIAVMAARLSSFPVGDYLLSEGFSAFLREHDLEEAWSAAIDSSRDRPNLYGTEVMTHAFAGFLQHVFHRQPEDFPEFFIGFLTGFSCTADRPLPLHGIRRDLADLGFPGPDLEKKLSALRRTGHRNRTCRAMSTRYRKDPCSGIRRG